MAKTADVMQYFAEHPGSVVYAAQIGEKLNWSEVEVRNTINNARHGHKEFDDALEVVVRGNAWRWHPITNKPKPGKRMFEELGTAKDGSVVIEDEEGKLYRAVEL